MKKILIVLLVACAPDTDSADDSLTTAKPKTADSAAPLKAIVQPASDPNDAALLADDRISIKASVGDLVSPKDFSAAFATGLGVWSVGSEARSTEVASLDLARYTRNCNNVTGCTPWHFDNNVLKHTLTLSYDKQGALWITQRDAKDRVLAKAALTDSKTAVTLAAHLTASDVLDTMRFVVELRDGSFTLETVIHSRDLSSETQEWGWSSQYLVHLKSQPARPSADVLPTVNHARTCADAPATADELVSWFNAGAVDAPFTNTENFAFTRFCQELTGCSEWVADPDHALLAKLAVKDKTSVELVSSRGEEFPLTGSENHADRNDIVVGAGCVRAVSHRAVVGPTENWLDLYDSGFAFKSSLPGDQ